MPTVRIYIREKAWAKLMKEQKHDRRKAKKKIAKMVHDVYV